MSLLSPFRVVGALALIGSLLPVVGASAASAAPGDVVINEVRIDQPGSDVDEYVELAGTPGAALDGYTFLVIGDGAAFAGSGVIENVTPLDGYVLDANGLIVLAESTFTLGTAGQTVNLNFENGDNVTMLVVSGFVGAVGDDVDTDDDGTLDVTRWTEITDSVALVESLDSIGTERYYSATVVGPDGSFVPGHAFVCDGSWQIGLFDPVGGDDTPGAANACGVVEPNVDVVINEVDSDTPSTDAAEFVELFDGGAGNTPLDGLAVVFFNGTDNLSYNAFDLDGFSTDADGYFLLGNAAVSPDIEFASNGLQNGADAIAVYAADAASFPTGSAVTGVDLVDAVVYDTSDADDPELLVLLEAGQPQVDENANGDKDNQSSQRCPDGSGGARITSTFAQFAPTPGALNTCVTIVDPFGECLDGAATLISAVQGSGSASPLAGQSVVIEGVVTADFQSTLSLLYVQEEDAQQDADPATSEGIAVFTGASPAAVVIGDVVRVQGTVTEFFDLTEISPTDRIEMCPGAAGTASPASITLPDTDARDLEAFESMLAEFPQTLTVTDTFDLGRFGEIVLSADGRQYRPTHVFAPAPGLGEDLDGDFVPDSLEPGRIVLDDLSNGSMVYGPGELPPYVNGEGTRRIGDTVTGLTAIVDWAFSEYRLRPVGEVPFVDANLRGPAPDPGGDVTVASFNVSDFFDTPDNDTPECGPGGDQDCRGADSAVELQRQQDKITSAIVEMNADVVGLIEIENDGTALDTLVAGLPGHAAIDTGPIGIDAVKVAFIYQPATIAPVGAPAVLDASIDPRFDDTRNRPALAQAFEHLATGDRFTVVVNHLESRGSPCDDAGDPDTGNGSGNCDGVRTQATAALADWLAADPTGESDGDVLIIGDLNAYAQEAPITTLETAGYTDLLEAFVPFDDRYSYVFRGATGYLDHALANDSQLANVAGAAVWHINADEPRFTDYNDDIIDPTEPSGDLNPAAAFSPDAYRSSAHDPVLVGLDMEAVETTLHDDLSSLAAAVEDGANGDRHALSAAHLLRRTLDDRYWLDGETLSTKGSQALRLHSTAASKLHRSGLDDEVVDAWLSDLYSIDRSLATGAIEAAEEDGGRPLLIRLARFGVATGDRLQGFGYTSAAIKALRLAWLWASWA